MGKLSKALMAMSLILNISLQPLCGFFPFSIFGTNCVSNRGLESFQEESSAETCNKNYLPAHDMLYNEAAIFQARQVNYTENLLENKSGDKAYAENFEIKIEYYFILLAGMFFVFSLLAHYTLMLKKRHYEEKYDSEMKFRNITNNINGGVLVLLPQRNYKAEYFNDGFLKLIHKSGEEFNGLCERDYINFVHPGDVVELKKLMVKTREKEENDRSFSIQLRIKQDSITYIPAILNGSYVRSERGEEKLYCVIMDLSRELTILERLAFEQERYRILIEKSDEILYEVDFSAQTICISKKFEEKFGWNLPEKYWGEAIPDLLHIYEEDRPEFAKMLKAINGDIVDGECMVRVYNSGFEPRWCRIFFHVMRKDGIKTWLIGKLVDIDDEMKEKQNLLYKAETDSLTGLYNKEAFKSRCEDYLANNPDVNCAVIFFDIDNFKEINDNLGHTAGDKALKDVSAIVRENFSENDILGRFGGDEFCILVKDVSKESLEFKLGLLVEKLSDQYISDRYAVDISASI
ncbi:MAG: diguanylate cyclase [Clostridiales bacterium]|nr:diguanylate cyclase [Clostridiales bacterium]